MSIKKIIDNFKITKLMYLLRNRGAINNEEAVGLLVVNTLNDFKPNEREEILNSRKFLMYTGKPLFRRAMKKIFYEHCFFEKAEFDYYNNVLPYLRTHSLISILRVSKKLKYI